jgi:hypothetical protein
MAGNPGWCIFVVKKPNQTKKSVLALLIKEGREQV